MSRQRAVYICGGDYGNLERRSACPNDLHNWPLPRGYVDAGVVAEARLRHRWSNKKCRDCGEYGWQKGQVKGDVLESSTVEVKPHVKEA